MLRPLSPHEANRGEAPAGADEAGARSIRVVFRVRPQRIAGDSSVSERPPHAVVLQRPYFDRRAFEADDVLTREATQADAYASVGLTSVHDVVHGFNATVLAFGATGSGKTHTMYGLGLTGVGAVAAADDALVDRVGREGGIVARAAMDLCGAQARAQRAGRPFELSMRAYEVYLERVTDLLGAGGAAAAAPKIREDGERGVRLDGLVRVAITGGVAQALRELHRVVRARQVSATRTNRASSRSHTVVELEVRTAGRASVLTLVDLAGSERVHKSRSQGERLEEAKAINRSVSALGNCISALASGGSASAPHVPFRNSKITRLLTNALAGNSKTCIVATISADASSYDENVSTLLFAMRARAVQTRPVAAMPERAPYHSAIKPGLAQPAPPHPGQGARPHEHALARADGARSAAERARTAEEAAWAAEEEHDLHLIRRLRAELARHSFITAAAALDSAHLRAMRPPSVGAMGAVRRTGELLGASDPIPSALLHPAFGDAPDDELVHHRLFDGTEHTSEMHEHHQYDR